MLTGGRLAAAILMMLAMIGAMVTYLDDARFFREDWPAPIVAAALIGFAAGWSQLGGSLGRDFLASGMFGIGAAVVAIVFFALIYGIRSAWITHFGVQFDAPIDVVAHIITTGLTVLESAIASRRTLAALILGSMTAGIIAEYFNRIWR